MDYLGGGGDSKVDPELQEFLLIEKQKAQVNAQVRFLNFNNFRKSSNNLISFRFTSLMKSAGKSVSISQEVNWTREQRHVLITVLIDLSTPLS
jgi:hypothetical protein